MVAGGEDDLICDLAQTYHIIDWRGLPLNTAAVLAFGLPKSSRTMMRLSGQKITVSETLLAACVDRLSMLMWLNSADSRNGKNRPESILPKLTGQAGRKTVTAFVTPEEFWQAVESIERG